jgi:hypothetical protein
LKPTVARLRSWKFQTPFLPWDCEFSEGVHDCKGASIGADIERHAAHRPGSLSIKQGEPWKLVRPAWRYLLNTIFFLSAGLVW